MYFVYILQSIKNETYYVGSTGDVHRRLKEHNQGLSRSTRPYRPWRIRKIETFNTLSQARKREQFIKKKKSKKIIEIIIKSSEGQ